MKLRRRQTRALLEAWLIQALFGKSRRAGQSGSGSLTPAVFTQGFVSWVFAALAFEGSSPRAFMAGNLAFVVLLATSALIGELDDERERPADRDFVGATPTLRRTVLVARWLRQGIVSLLFAGGIAIAPAILSGFKTQNLVVPPLFVLATCVLSTGATILFASATRLVAALLGGDRATSFSTVVRALLLGGGFVAMLLGLRAMLGGSEVFPGGRSLLEALPTTWFADAIRTADLTALLLVVAFCGATLLLGLVTAQLPERSRSSAKTSMGGLTPAAIRTLVKDPQRRGLAAFTLDMLVRERSFRLRALPLLGLPAAAALLALRSDVEASRLPTMLALVHQLPAAYLPFLLLFVPYAENARASWLVALRLEDPERAYRRSFEVALGLLILPVQALLLVVDASLLSFEAALGTTLGAVGIAWASMSVIASTVRGLAFSIDPDELEVPSDFSAPIGFALAMTVLSFALAALQRSAGLMGGLALFVAGGALWAARARST